MTRLGLRAAAVAALAAVLLAPAAGADVTDPGDAVDPALEAAQPPSVVEVFREDWESAPSIEEAGWDRQAVAGDDPVWRRLHRDDDPRPDATAPTSSPPHLATTMGQDGTYPAGADARLVSPVLDLRHVRGTSADTTQAHDDPAAAPFLTDLARAYAEERPDQYLFTTGYHELLYEPPSQWFPVPCPRHAPGLPCYQLAQGYDDDSTTRGEEGWDGYRPDPDGACIEVRFFFYRFERCASQQDVPVPGTSQLGVFADEEGDVHGPDPADDREGAGHVNLTFWHAWDLARGDAAYLEVRHLRADGTWSPWRVLEPDANPRNRPDDSPTSPSAEVRVFVDGRNRTLRPYEEDPQNRTAGPYNGWHDEHRAFTGSSGGLTSSTFDLSRLAGTRIQLAWRLDSVRSHTDAPGWFVDDVAVRADVPARDVGVRTVDRPGHGDTVAPDEVFHPAATVRNYGHQPAEDLTVAFEVLPAGGDEVLWRNARTLDGLAPQEQVRVASPGAFEPGDDLQDPSGAYRLRAEVALSGDAADPDASPGSTGPQTSRHRGNDARSVPLQVQAVPRADVTVDVADASVQTDVGEAKTFTVRLDNTGNTPLSGTVEVTATLLNRTTLEPAASPEVVAAATVDEGALPHGKDLTLLGAEDDTWNRTFTWDDPTPQGVHRLAATFQPEAGPFAGETLTYVRATPPSPYQEDAATDSGTPFADDSVYSADTRVRAWTAAATGWNPTIVTADETLPDPPSPSHVWLGRGSDEAGSAAPEASAPASHDKGHPQPPEAMGPGDGNRVDHYWLSRTLDLRPHADADAITLSFWHHGNFDWTGRATADQPQADHARGRVEIVPDDTDVLADPTQSLGPADPGHPDNPARRAGAGDLTVVAADEAYAQPLASYTSDVPWTRERLDLTPWAGQNVTLRFHLETTADRDRVNDTDAGSLTPWLLDDLRVVARAGDQAEPVVESDLEGDDWRRWSAAQGARLQDPRSPLAVADGRGWERHAYGATGHPTGWNVAERTRPDAGERLQGPVFRWGDPVAGDDLAPDVNLSVLETPTLDLDHLRDPVLTFRHLHAFRNPPGLTASHAFPHVGNDDLDHVVAGGSVWIVGEDGAGDEVTRELLVPAGASETTYDAPIANWYTENGPGSNERRGDCRPISSDGREEPGGNELHCETPLRAYPTPATLAADEATGSPAETRVLDGNVFTGRSGRQPQETGPARWERAVLDLSPYARAGNASLDYHVEFHAIDQRRDDPDGVGWLVDDVQVTEATKANDVGLAGIETPGRGDPVGPGLNVTIEGDVANRGLYDQAGVAVQARVLGPDGGLVYGPETLHTDEDHPIPGLRSGDPGVRTVTFPNWTTPEREGTYRIEVEAILEDSLQGHADPDRNASNDLATRTIEVREVREVALASHREAPARQVVRPYIASPDRARTLAIPVENVGTMPEDPTLDVTVHRNGSLAFQASTTVPDLRPRTTRTVAFHDAWTPDGPGPFEATFRLQANESVADGADDNTRRVAGPVPQELLPGPNTTLEEAYVPTDANWTHDAGAWHVGANGAYPNGTDARLHANGTLELRPMAQGLVRIHHGYAFEEAYDGGRLEVRPQGSEDWIPVPPRTGPGPDAPARYPTEMAPGSPLRADPHEPSRAWSGTAPGEDVQVHDLGDVPALTSRTRLLDDDLRNATVAGADKRPDSPRHGDWSSTYLSRIEPHSGDTMWHSNATVAYPLNCWRHWTENNGTSDAHDCTLKETVADSRKYLNVTFDRDFPPDRTPLAERLQDGNVSALRVSFWDAKAIGLVHTVEGTGESDLGARNEVSLHLRCLGDACSEDDRVVLDPVDADGYDDNYRNWTRNVYDVPVETLEAFAGPGKALRVSWVHHVMNGETSRAWSTDARSLHAGWFLDDVEVALVDEDGNVTPYWSDDVEDRERFYIHGFDKNETTAHDESAEDGRQEVLLAGPWDGDAVTYLDPTSTVCGSGPSCKLPRLLWDPVHAWGGEARCRADGDEVACDQLAAAEQENATVRHGLWRHVEAGELPCGPLVDGATELAEETHYGHSRQYPEHYRASSTHLRACGPTGGHRERAGGARLTTPVDLTEAVGNVTLTFGHEHRFRHPSQEPEVGRSGGRLEVSLDGGGTWIPLKPISNETRPMQGQNETEATAQFAAHTTFGDDPESNSPYGIGGRAWTGVSGHDRDLEDGAEPVTAKYDLSRFAGQEIHVAWHAYFGTHNFTQSRTVDQTGGAYEYWALHNVSVEADVLDTGTVDLRLRAASDATGTDDGWTVDRLDVLGVNRSADPGIAVVDPAEGAVLDDTNTVTVALANGGSSPATVDATLQVRGPDGATVFHANESGITLEAGDRVLRTSLGGEDLAFQAEPGQDYVVAAEVQAADPAVARQQLPHDDRDTVLTGPARPEGALEVTEVAADPDHLDPANGTGTRIAATVTNRGHGTVHLAAIEANVTPADGDGPSLVLDGDDLDADPNRTFEDLGETRTYAWDVPAADLAALDEGLHRVRVTAREGDGDERRNRTSAFLGPSFVEALGYEQEVRADSLSDLETCEYTNQDARPPGSGGGSSATPTSATWEVENDSSRSGTRSLAWPVPDATQPGRGGATCHVQETGALTPDLRDDLRLHLWTRYRFPRDSAVYNVSAGFESDCSAGNIAGLPRFDMAQDRGETPAFADDAYVPRSFALPPWDDQDDAAVCLSVEVREDAGDVHVDDLVVAPLDVAAGPEPTVPVREGTTKTFPVVVANPGSFDASLDLALEDALGFPADGPPGWSVSTSPPLDEPLAVPPGGEKVVRVTVSVPDGAADETDVAEVGLAATSGQTPHVRDAAVMTLVPRT